MTSPLWDAWSFGDGEAYAVGEAGVILHRANGAWAPETSGTLEYLQAIWASGKSVLYAGGGDASGLILRSDGTGTWVPETLPPGAGRIYALSGTTGDDVYASTTDSVYHREANGTWVELSDPPFGLRIWVAGPGDLYRTGFAAVHHFSNDAWADEPTPGELQLDVCGSADQVFIVAEHGVAATKSGGVWTGVQQGVAEPVRCRYAGNTNVVVFGSDPMAPDPKGRVSYLAATTDTYSFAHTIWGGGASPSDVIAVGDAGAIYRAVIP